MDGVSADDEPLRHDLLGFEAEYKRWPVLMKGLSVYVRLSMTQLSLLHTAYFVYANTCRFLYYVYALRVRAYNFVHISTVVYNFCAHFPLRV